VSGGYAGTPHCDRTLLVRDARERDRWRRLIVERGFRIAALNAWGNPLDPDRALARRHDADVRETIRLAAAIGVDRVLTLAGCPGEGRPRFAAGGWLPYLEGDHERQWAEIGAPYWSELAEFARREQPALVICVELHPGTLVYNLETFSELAGLGDNLAANVDPSHLFWMQMDPLAVVARLPRIAHAHLKDVVFDQAELAVNGVLDHRWRADARNASWRFASVGRGHDRSWWRLFIDALASRGVETAAIEHEDPLVAVEEGIVESAALFATAARRWHDRRPVA
jgi:sugar phosphate isomerase/epimerase